MSTNLSTVWAQVEKLLDDNISVIPVRDKDEQSKFGDIYLAKTPYAKWKEFQKRRITREELWQLMEEKNTSAVAIVCGEISGNMEVIDVDVKYKPGISAILLKDIKTFFPNLFSRLRIHETPSTGLHIPYRVEGHVVPGNLKLAGRMASEDEIQLQIERGTKRPNKEFNFLETRGEGGYILCPPSLGYKVHQDNPIPLITWEERCNLITLCESYNEVIKEVPVPKPAKAQESFYDENPFEHFNRAVDPVELLEGYGWKFSHKNSHFLWFTRPDKQRGVSASWNLAKQIFYIFTSSTELQANRGYHPASVLAELQFNGDKSATYHHLVKSGYGKVKAAAEERIVNQAASAGKPIPANFSQEAKASYTLKSEQLKQDHPHGTFIKYDIEEEKFAVSRESLVYVAGELGFRYYDGDVVRIAGFIIDYVDERTFQDELKNYIREEDPEEYENLCNTYEAFMQRNGKYTLQRLPKLATDQILSDKKEVSYKFYSNGYITITAEDIVFSDYATFAHLIWKDRLQQREFAVAVGKGGKFVDYLTKALTDLDQARKVLGYLAHEYKDETTGYIIVLTEQCPDPKQGGGSGKNVFCNLLKLTTTYTSKPGAQAKFDEKFFQSWNRQRIFGISDVPKNFDFAFLKEPATGSFIWKKLFKDEIEIPVEEAPKFIVQTNFSYENSDGGLTRRIIPLEFTNYFTACGGLDVHYGCHFPNGWSDADYAGFDNFIAESIHLWLKDGRKLHATELTETGWVKQWEHTYGNATGFILENWDAWVLDGFVTNETFKKRLEEYCSENNIAKHYFPSSAKINNAIESYSNHHGINFKRDVSVRFPNGVFKSRVFFKDGQEPDQISDQSEQKQLF